MKTLVLPAHVIGPRTNGFDGCYSRGLNSGICPGGDTAAWLNSLGDDDDVYMTIDSLPVTNLRIRMNWLNSQDGHIVVADPELLRLRAAVQQCTRDLQQARRRLKEYERLHQAAQEKSCSATSSSAP